MSGGGCDGAAGDILGAGIEGDTFQGIAGAKSGGSYLICPLGDALAVGDGLVVSLIFNDQTIVYGSTPAEATATPASAKIEYSYTTEAGGTPTPGWPANAGTYTVTAK